MIYKQLFVHLFDPSKKRCSSKYQSAPVSENKFISNFLRYRNIQVLTREVIVELIEMIYVHEGGTITIQFKYQDEYQRLLDLIDEQGLASAAG